MLVDQAESRTEETPIRAGAAGAAGFEPATFGLGLIYLTSQFEHCEPHQRPPNSQPCKKEHLVPSRHLFQRIVKTFDIKIVAVAGLQRVSTPGTIPMTPATRDIARPTYTMNVVAVVFLFCFVAGFINQNG